MNSWTFNKIAGAVLGTALFVFGLEAVTGVIFHPTPASADKPGMAIEVAGKHTGCRRRRCSCCRSEVDRHPARLGRRHQRRCRSQGLCRLP